MAGIIIFKKLQLQSLLETAIESGCSIRELDSKDSRYYWQMVDPDSFRHQGVGVQETDLSMDQESLN